MGIGVIRTLLAISVVLAHTSRIYGFNLVDGRIAVECFFIISGFYMALILNEKYVGPKSAWMFYSNRFLKLYPIYWFVLLLTLVLAATSAMHYGAERSYCLRPWIEHGAELSPFQKSYLVGANLVLFGQDGAFLMKFDSSNGLFGLTTDCWADKPPVWSFLIIPPAWTLGVELLFYCVAPIIVRQKPVKLLALVGLSLLLRVVFVRAGYDRDPWTYRFFPLELAFFCAGSYAYTVYRGLKAVQVPRWLPPAVTLGTIALLLSFNSLPGPYDYRQWGVYVALVAALPLVFQYSKSKRIDRFLGELSYPVYIAHVLICSIVRRFCDSGSAYGILAVAATLAGAIVLYLGVQLPIDQYRQRRVCYTESRAA